MTTIYILKDPNTNEIRYVGKTINIKRRYYQHTNKKFQEKTKTYVANWILSLLKNGQKPIIESIEQCLDWEEKEVYWISYYKNLGCNLCNLAEGGKGCSGYRKTEEQKKKHSEAFKGKNTWMKGKIFSQEWKNNISKAQKGKNNNFYGRHFTEEMKEKQRVKKISKPIKAFNTVTLEKIIFKSIADCWKQLNLKKSNIISYLKGRYNGKTYRGWQFTYC